jgi:hypothetical protein
MFLIAKKETESGNRNLTGLPSDGNPVEAESHIARHTNDGVENAELC